MATKIKEGRREHFRTSSGIELPVDFNPSNSEPVEYDRELGDPGDFPYTRGIRRNMYRGRLWTMRQYAGYATAEESNARYKYLLSQGTTGLSVAFDLPTQIGLDSDDPLAAGEVGKVGVAIASVGTAVKAGLGIDEFAPRISFFFNSHNNLLEEIAKFRAARRLWARIMRERFHARDPRSLMMRFHTQTAGSTLTAQQPEVNVVRTTIQALAAVLGGTQSLHTNAMDEALALPTEDAARLALRTQQVIAYESGVADTVDPLAGSYAIEELTTEIEQRVVDYLNKIDALGGTLRAIESGYMQREIQNSAYEYQRAVETNDAVVVGVNQFQSDEGSKVKTLRVDPSVEADQIKHLESLRDRRDSAATELALMNLEQAARSTENVLPRILECVEVFATVGEISNRLRNVWGEYREAVTL